MNNYDNGKYYTVELELVNGDVIIRSFDKSKLYGFKQITSYSWSFCTSFPFITKKKKVYTTFRYQDQYTLSRSQDDSRFNVNCNLSTILLMFDIDYKSWSEAILKDTIQNG